MWFIPWMAQRAGAHYEHIEAWCSTSAWCTASNNNRSLTLKVLPSGKNKTDNWLTPPELVRSLGAFDLDPCGSPDQAQDLAATTFRLPEHNGLLEPWAGRVWCNPPFSHMPAWAQRFAVHANGVMVCPAKFQYKWSHVLWETADGILLLTNGIRWVPTKWMSNGGKLGNFFDFMLVAYGRNNVSALRSCDQTGTLVTTRELLRSPGNILTLPPNKVESPHGHKVLPTSLS
jgi:hypothetical protein